MKPFIRGVRGSVSRSVRLHNISQGAVKNPPKKTPPPSTSPSRARILLGFRIAVLLRTCSQPTSRCPDHLPMTSDLSCQSVKGHWHSWTAPRRENVYCPDHKVDCGRRDLRFAASNGDLYLFDHRPETERTRRQGLLCCLIVPPPASTFFGLFGIVPPTDNPSYQSATQYGRHVKSGQSKHLWALVAV